MHQLLNSPPNTKQLNTQLSNLGSNSKHSVAKKRIGQYSYYPFNIIGSGYSSNVYKAKKKNNPSVQYAIKVIRLANISVGNYQLLQNQINILKQLDHPNIIKFHDVYYTQNNCYIITDYCEGGTLQNYVESTVEIKWEQICKQIVEACKYLGEKLIVHRDIKPANIFLKDGIWKLGDFGFARFLPSMTSYVKQMYAIGSPLYMPPETLQKNIYSLKTDSFALGILLFHLVTRQFPWSGNNKRQLLDNYANKSYPSEKISFLPETIQKYLKGLCQIQISRRLYISEFDGIVSKTLQGENSAQKNCLETNSSLQSIMNYQFNLNTAQKFKLCRFLSFIDINIQHFTELCELSELIRRNIKYFLILFGWGHGSPQEKYMEEFRCRNYKQFESKGQIQEAYDIINQQIDGLHNSSIQRLQVLRNKLTDYLQIVECLLSENLGSLGTIISTLILNPDFSKVAHSKQATTGRPSV